MDGDGFDGRDDEFCLGNFLFYCFGLWISDLIISGLWSFFLCIKGIIKVFIFLGYGKIR